jgi:predicted small secreted protein
MACHLKRLSRTSELPSGLARKEGIVKRVHKSLLTLTAACCFAFAGVACDNTARGVKEDSAHAADAAKDATAASKDKADAATAAAKAESRDEANDAKRAAGSAGAAIDAAKETLDVKAALTADSTVDASDINVDTFHETKTVVLKGSVPTAAQKTEAARIAGREATGYKVDNQLVVKPKS